MTIVSIVIGAFDTGRDTAIETITRFSLKSYVQTASPFARVNKKQVLLTLALWSKCSKN